MTIDAATESTRNRRSIILILLIGMIAYFNSYSGAFLLDDGYTIVYNNDVNDFSLKHLRATRALIHYVNAINHLADGGNPRGYHLVNLTVHLLAALTLFGLVRRTLLLPRWSQRVREASRPLALTIALLWMVHPLQTASVTYIIQRCESMMGLFYLLSMYCFARSADSDHPFWWYVLSIFAGMLSIGCKEIAVTLPLVILAYDWVFLRPGLWKLLKRRGWYYLLFTGILCLTFYFWMWQTMVGGYNSSALGFDTPHFTSWEYLLSESHVIVHYVQLSFWPHPLSLDYQDWPVVRSWRDCLIQGLFLGLPLLFSLVAIALRWWAGFAIFAFFAILAPTSSVMPIQDLIFNHRMYLSLAAIISLVIGIGWGIGNFMVHRGYVPYRAMAAIQTLMVVGLVSALTIATMMRNHDYRSRLDMWSDVVKKRPNCVRALAEVVSQTYFIPEKLEEARTLGKRSVELMPVYADGRYYYGMFLFQQGEYAAAEVQFEYLTRLSPENGVYPRMEGLCYLAQGRDHEAATAFREAVKRMPKDAWTKMFLGIGLLETGDSEAAAAVFAELHEVKDFPWAMAVHESRQCAFRDDPTPVHKRLAILYAQGGNLAMNEKQIELLDALAVAYSVSDRFDEAQTAAQKAIALAEEKKDTAAIKRLTFRLERYRQHKKLAFGESR